MTTTTESAWDTIAEQYATHARTSTLTASLDIEEMRLTLGDDATLAVLRAEMGRRHATPATQRQRLAAAGLLEEAARLVAKAADLTAGGAFERLTQQLLVDIDGTAKRLQE